MESKILRLIEEIRKELDFLVNQKGTLQDNEIIIASKMLDAVLNEYNKLLEEKRHKEK